MLMGYRRSVDVVLVVIALAGLLLRIWLAAKAVPNGLFDDAYITLRYAKNLLNGQGFVYNAGERVWGTTSPLFTLLLSGGGYIAGEHYLEMLAVLFGVLASIGALILTARALWIAEVRGSVLWIYPLFFALLPPFVINSASGMETPLVLFLMAWSLLCYVHRQWTLLGLVAGLLLLARIDTAIWLTALAFHSVTERRMSSGESAKAMGALLVSAFPWFLFAFFYFGTLIPQSVVGKAVSHSAFSSLDWGYFLAFVNIYFPIYFLTNRFGHLGWGVVTLGLIIVAVGLQHLWRRYPLLRPVGTFFALYNAAFLLSRAPLFSWYFTPAEWAFYLLFSVGLEVIVICGARGALSACPKINLPFPRFVWWGVRIGVGCTAALLIAYSGRSLVARLLGPPEPNPNTWTKVSAFLRSHTKPGASIFLANIGLPGYILERYIFDSNGLITPPIVAIKRQFGKQWLPVAIRKFEPDCVLLYHGQSQDMTDEAHLFSYREGFHREYTPVARFGMLDPLVPYVTVYFRKNSRHVIWADLNPKGQPWGRE